MRATANPIRAYEDAMRDFRNRVADFETMRRNMQRATVALIHGWRDVCVSGITDDFPRHVHESPSHRVIDAEEWPTAEQIAKVLLSVHEAHDQALVAWSNVPTESRYTLQQPPEE